MKNTNNTDNQTILLSNGTFVHPEFLIYIRDVVTARIPSLFPNTTYELKQICSDYFWDLLDKGEKIKAGWCMVHLAANGELPMISVNKCRHQSPKKYRLK